MTQISPQILHSRLGQPHRRAAPGFHVMVKPIGPICNLDCTYCYYLEKERFYPQERTWKMNDQVLDNYIKQFIDAYPAEAQEIPFAWQGGEPTLLGVRFFEKVVEIQKKYAAGRTVTNALQTNGTLLDDEWGAFLGRNKFLIGISIDGPPELHDHYRVDKKQQPTSHDVLRGLGVLKKHGVDFNTLTVVNRVNSLHPIQVYEYLRGCGSRFFQFIPLVERLPEQTLPTVEGKHILAEPLAPGETKRTAVTDWSVEPKQFGRFLCEIFDRWVRSDVGRIFVQQFDVALGNWAGAGSSLCHFAETCGRAVVMEHNGDVYSCDHFVYPRYHLGNIEQTTLGEMLESPEQIKFGNDKADTLPRYCRECEVRFACNGECPKHRFIYTPDGEPGLNYLCAGYRQFFNHIDPYMKTMAQLLQAGRAPSQIMGMLARPNPGDEAKVGRNDPCPCGSGRKYKKCCGQSA
ncbi:MAG: anaerobic sulfatase-maturation protein [Phycisphaeraceae bacterium]|nr:anaerobic sulfatase-maturation protein [Phycisphaeraceae bacterium]